MLLRCFYIFILLFAPTILFAQSCFIRLFDKNGDYVNYKLNNRPRIEYHDGDMSIITPNTIISYPLNRLGKYTLTQTTEEYIPKDIELFDGMISSFWNESVLSDCTIEYSRFFSDTEWQPLYLPFEMEYEELSDQFDIAALNNIRQYDDDEDSNFDRMEIEIRLIKNGKIKANNPYLIRAKEIGQKTLSLSSRELFPTHNNSLECSSTDINFKFTGTYVEMAEVENNDCLVLEKGLLKNLSNCSYNLPPFRWYMTMQLKNSNNNNIGLIRQIAIVEENTSSIKTSFQENNLQTIYDLNGVKRSNVAKGGIYIVKFSNGVTKKVIIK